MGSRMKPLFGRVLVDVMMAVWGGLICLLIVDLVSRFAGLPIPGSVMLPFLVVCFLVFTVFGVVVLAVDMKTVTLGELVVAGAAFLVAALLLLDAACCLLCRSYRSYRGPDHPLPT